MLLRIVAISSLAMLAVALGGVSARAEAAAPDATPSPAGPVIGSIVIFSPTVGAVPAFPPAPPAFTPTRPLFLPVPAPPLSQTVPGPVLPGVLVTTPTPVGSLVVPVRPPAGSVAAPAFTQLQLVIPGPTPAQNTPIGLAQLLDSILRSVQARGPAGTAAPTLPVTVFATSP